jgi:hypothetical protein
MNLKRVKKKRKTFSPLPFSLQTQPAHLSPSLFSAARKLTRAAGLSHACAPAAHAGPARSPAGPSHTPSFSFCDRSLTGGARPSGPPLPPAAGQPHPPPFKATGRYQQTTARPSLHTELLSRSEASTSLSRHQSTVSPP